MFFFFNTHNEAPPIRKVLDFRSTEVDLFPSPSVFSFLLGYYDSRRRMRVRAYHILRRRKIADAHLKSRAENVCTLYVYFIISFQILPR